MEESLDELQNVDPKSKSEETTEMEKKTDKMMVKWMRRRHKTQTFDTEEIPTSPKKKKNLEIRIPRERERRKSRKGRCEEETEMRDDLPPVFHSILHEPCRLDNNGISWRNSSVFVVETRCSVNP